MSEERVTVPEPKSAGGAWRFAGPALVLAVAAALRLIGITWGLPDATHVFSYHPDEFHSLRGAFSMALGDLNPHFFNYGSLSLYLVGAAAALAHGEIFASISDAVPGGPILPGAIRAWTLDARIVTVIFAVATVAVVYAIAREIWNHRAGLAAALLLALAPLHVLHSHYATVDVPGAFFVALALLLAVRMMHAMTLRNAAWAGIACGLAASVKYSGALVLVAPLAAWLLAFRDARATPEDRPPIGALVLPPLAALAAFALTSPYTFLDWPNAWRDISFEMAHMRAGDDLWMMAAWPNGWLFHLSGLALGTGFIMLAASAVGLTSGLAVGRRELLPLLVFGLVAFAVIGNSAVRYARYEMPLLPVLAVLAGGLVSNDLFAMVRGRMPAWGMAAAITTLLAGSAWGAAVLDQRMLRELVLPDARDLALQAIEREVPAGGTVGLISEPWFYQPPVDYCNGGEALCSNPTWREYRRSVRPLVVLGLDPERLLLERPDAMVVTGWEVDGPLRGGDPEVVAFMDAPAQTGYEVSSFGGGLSHWSQRPRPPASDWLYPFVRVELWRAADEPFDAE